MPLDRSLGGQLDMTIRNAIARSLASLEVARRLLSQGLAGPAYVWAVRSVEIYVKEVMLLPLYLEELEGDWTRARKKVRKTFGSSNWGKAIALVDSSFGPLDPMRTEEGQDVWEVWQSIVIRRRGEIVHGRDDPSVEDAATVVLWAGRMMEQLPLRLIVAQKHPLHDFFVAIIEKGREALGPNHGVDRGSA